MPVNTAAFDPIIQAIFRSSQAQAQAKQQAEVERVNKVKEDQHNEEVAAEQGRFQQTQDLANQHLKLQRTQFEADQKNQEALLHEHAFTRLANTIAAGGKPQEGVSQPQFNSPESGLPAQSGSSSTFRDPLSGQDFAQSLFPTQQSLMQNKLDEKEGELKLADKYASVKQGREAEYDQKLLSQKQTFDANESKLDRETRLKIAQDNETGANFRANLAARTRLNGGLGSDDEDTIGTYINDMYVTGNTNESQVPQKIRGAIKGTVPTGWTPLVKRDIEQIDGIPIMQEFFNTIQELATKGSTLKGKAGVITGLGDAGRLKKQTEGLMGNIARLFGGEKGVLTQRDIERGSGLVFQILQGSSGNQKLVNDLKDDWKAKLQGFTQKYPEDQRKQIFSSRAIDPSFMSDVKAKGAAATEEWERGPDGKPRRKSAK